MPIADHYGSWQHTSGADEEHEDRDAEGDSRPQVFPPAHEE
jgi:hypothetical protein